MRTGPAPVVTGLGVVAPTGIGVEAYWRATLAGTNAIGPITLFDATGYPVRLAGEVRGFSATDHLSSRLIVQTDRWTRLGLAATAMALADADAARLQRLRRHSAGSAVTCGRSAAWSGCWSSRCQPQERRMQDAGRVAG